MAVTLTNTPARISSASATSHTVSLGFTPTSGRTLVVGWYTASGTVTFTSIDADWTLIHDNTNASRVHGCGWAYRISDGTETTFSINCSSSQALVFVFLEFDGLVGSAVLDQSAESTANQNSTNATSASTGTTGTLSVSDGYALSFFSSDGQTGWDTGRSYTDSSTELFTDLAVGGTSTPGCIFAYKVLSSTTGFSETISTTDAGDGMYGSVAVFKQASGGNNYNQSISGSVTSSGVVARLISRTVAGSSTSSGMLNKHTTRSAFTSSITPSSDLAETGSLAQSISGSITVSGVLSNAATYVRSYASSITLSGGLVNAISKMLSGTITLTGNVYKGMSLLLSGTITALGNLTVFKFTPTIGERVNRGMRFLRRFIGRR